jgi:hypothetical protein
VKFVNQAFVEPLGEAVFADYQMTPEEARDYAMKQVAFVQWSFGNNEDRVRAMDAILRAHGHEEGLDLDKTHRAGILFEDTKDELLNEHERLPLMNRGSNDIPQAPASEDRGTIDDILPEREWTEPPAPRGKGGQRKAGGYSADKAAGTNTELGRQGEELFAKLVGRDEAKILHAPGKGEQSPLDVQVDGKGFEVKAVSSDSTSYKATPKPHELTAKEKFAQELGIDPALAIVVIDRETGNAYIYIRDGLAGGRLSQNTGWKYVGSVPLPTS